MSQSGRMDDDAPPLVDFTSGALLHRLRSGAARGGALGRAAKVTRGCQVIDATAGLGRDGLVLASLGAQVTLIERVPAIHDALADALARGRREGPADLVVVLARMTLLAGDARTWLAVLPPPRIVLVDPMHPDRGNTALVRQPMRRLRALAGTDGDVATLMQVALDRAEQRVVLKWPRLGAPITGLRAPSHSIAGRTTRYDVFVTARQQG